MESMSGSVPLRSATSEAILREIRADIITRKLKPGQKLTEQSVCEKYGISRSPVRTIFQQLEKEGMVIMLGNGCKQIVPFERNKRGKEHIRKPPQIRTADKAHGAA